MLTLDEDARKAGITAIIGMGASPVIPMAVALSMLARGQIEKKGGICT